MSEKDNKLPVRIFHKREFDERRTESGGGGKEPKWVLSGQELQLKANNLSDNLTVLKNDYLSKKYETSIPVTIGIKLNEHAIAKSHRESIETLFTFSESTRQYSMGLSPDDDLLFGILNSKHFEEIKAKFESFTSFSKGISAIDNLNTFKPTIEYPETFENFLKVKLLDYNNDELNKNVSNIFENLCSENKVVYEKKAYTKTLSIYKLRVKSKKEIEKIATFEGLQTIEPMPIFKIELDSIENSSSISIKNPETDKDYPTVGLLDSGISEIPYIKPWLIGKESTYPADYIDTSHGTFCSGIILYGDDFEHNDFVGMDGCFIFDATVFPAGKSSIVNEDELIDNIKEVVKNHSNTIKIWNLSLGTRNESSKQTFSDFAKVLDEIQENYNVLIVKSAGNCQNFLNDLPPSRISKSADSVRSLVVGSIAHQKSLNDISEINHPSPFSRIGPGPGFITKPDLVHYGGNAGKDFHGKMIPNGVKSFSKDGNITSNIGTSFSTPRITASIANLYYYLNKDFNSLLLKTLIIHSAAYPKEVKTSLEEKIKSFGFGLPPATTNILFNNENEITLILQDVLPKGQFIEILDFPYPDILIDEKGYFYGKIIVTLISNPILKINEGREYIQSDLTIQLGTFDKTKIRDISKPNIKNPIGKDNPQNLLLPSLYSRNKKRKDILFETDLIQYRDKFHPVKKYIVDLDEMKKGNRDKHLKSPKKWHLKIEGLYRRSIEQDAVINNKMLSQDFCLAITIIDTKNRHNIYDRVSNLLDVNQFIHHSIRINQNVTIRV